MERKQQSKERVAGVLVAARSLSLADKRATSFTKQRVLLRVFISGIFRRLRFSHNGLEEFGGPPARV